MKSPRKLTREAVVESFGGVDLGDERLNRRLESIVSAIATSPDKSFPQLFASEAELEAFYRFVRNPRVDLSALVAGHFEQTRERATAVEHAIAVHDTTELSFGDARTRRREGLGRLKRSNQGMVMHATLAVDPARSAPLGVLDAHVWTRPDEYRDELTAGLTEKQKRELISEGDKWLAQALRVHRDNPSASLVHVMDSEADDYSLFSYLSAFAIRYCVRVCNNRRLEDEAFGKLGDRLAALEPVCTRNVTLSRRGRAPAEGRLRHAPRPTRDASLSIAATTVKVKRPMHSPVSGALPPELEVNVVHVWEASVPDGEVPVQWTLFTSEPVSTADEMLAVVDTYKQRWLIEEYFKALKSGCSYEKRQLDSGATLEVALGLFIPIAAQLLALRALERETPTEAAATVLSKPEIFVLRKKLGKSFPLKPTVADALQAIARLGGHIKNNGAPGWMVLVRGYEELARLAAFAAELGVEM